MVQFVQLDQHYVRTSRVFCDKDGQLHAKVIVCRCARAGAKPKDCALVSGNKTPCRCDCHRDRI